MIWRARKKNIDLSRQGLILGILNVTPDSFSDGGQHVGGEAAVLHGMKLIEEGADIIDIGGESTRPGALPISTAEELARVLPVVQALRRKSDILLSVDTYKAETAHCCLEEGADIINDITALRGDPKMLSVAAETKAGLVLMHMQGTPHTMQQKPHYTSVSTEVRDFLLRRAQIATSSGVDPVSIALDPGIGFGKNFSHNRELLSALSVLTGGEYPVLVGVSRKSFLSVTSGARSVESRFWPGVALTSFCREKGVRLFRVHEPAPHREALKMTEAILLP
ncbi:Dihydropteroate synthase [Candidatus Xiphinematobacter sp. Idaho Grape]|uniref:dihydropteroate synthase n=1 Tax=Candidatus Xiphinematobacter sp. Idaho Grape TaxID=1704307 RepID=UPI00070634BA|nr:dihydropteroate synthase [Candidatus Xiphinematobacter sp. Idaho Grape]ALJ56221.1 Dihydropteroate synthase [Candidatus Xiphinematobacter sp. Idaho Grape]